MYAHFYLIHYFLSTSYINNNILQTKYFSILFDSLYCLTFFMLPLFGLFADVKTGRYKIIIAGIYTPLVS